MAYKKTISIILGFILAIILTASFYSKKECSVNIRYTLNYDADSWEKNRTGFLWALSYLGAELPKGSFDKALEWQDSCIFKLDISALGFNEKAVDALGKIIDSLKTTEQYRVNGYIDLTHFVTLTIGSSWHYYAITGVPKTYKEFKKQHDLRNEQVFAVTHSTVAKHHRLLKFISSDTVRNSVYIAEEGEGEITNNTFTPRVYEVLDVMCNGQLRFAIYDEKGELIPASPGVFGNAGKPAKCLWCHEIVFQPLFTETDSLINYMSPAKFQKIIGSQNELLSIYRRSKKSDINFENEQDHTFMELLYIAYMEPSLKKLSQEWNLNEEQLKKLLVSEHKHQHSEFGFMKDVYYRNDVEKHDPFKRIKVANDIREPSEYEPNFLK